MGGTPMRLVGVDGCRAGWVVAESDLVDSCEEPATHSGRDGPAVARLSPPSFSIVSTFAALLATLDGVRAVVAIDMPIGLASGLPHDDGRRRVDAEARAFLGPRRASSVFSAPCRPTLAATSYRDACGLESRSRGSGIGLSQQSFRIIASVRDVDEAIQPHHQEPVGRGPAVWVREAHPEVTFAALRCAVRGSVQTGMGLVHSKRGCTSCRGSVCRGEADRLALLRSYVADFEPRAVQTRLRTEHRLAAPPGGAVVGRDDVVDAVACLVTAYRIATGQAVTLPHDGPQLDARGLRMEIVA